MSIKKLCDGPNCDKAQAVQANSTWVVVQNGDLFDLHFCDWGCLFEYAYELNGYPQLPLEMFNADA